MAKLVVTNRDGTVREADGRVDVSLMEALREADFNEVYALCGGSCSCATCHVYLDPAILAHLPPIGADEADLLSGLDHSSPESRLSCQITFTDALDGLHVRIAPEE